MEELKPIQYPLVTLAVLALAIYVAYKNYPWWRVGTFDYQVDKWSGWVLGGLATILVWALCMAACSGLDAAVAGTAEWEWQTCWKANMISLRGSDGISGSLHGGIFMLAGQVGSEHFYHYYTTDKDGSFKPHKWKTGSTTRVYEEDRQDGQVVQWEKHFKSKWAYWFASPDSGLAMDFHIPKGSLKQQFSLQ